MKNILITGASGFVGQHLVNKLVKTTDSRLYLLVRRRSNSSALDRCKELFSNHSELIGERIIPVEAELELPYFGLLSDEFRDFFCDINVIYHTAATIKFNLPYDQAYSINVNGTKNCLAVAQEAGEKFQRFHHVGTAFVNTVLNDGKKRSFNNTYEQTKFEAELLFKETPKIPFTIYRPSIVSGSSETGELASSSVIFKFIVLLSKNLLNTVPADPSSSLNIIPVNNFVDKMLAIGAQSNSEGKIFQITHHENTKFRELLEQASKLLQVTPPRFVSNQQIKEIPVQIMKHLEVFLPYIFQSQQFILNPHELNSVAKQPCDNVIRTLKNTIKHFNESSAHVLSIEK